MIEIKNRFTGEIIKSVDSADLSDADLRDADLSGANLRGADLSDADFIALYLPFYYVHIHTDTIRIGCKHYTKAEWEGFTDDEISKMDITALEFWTMYKPLIMAAAKLTGE